MSLPETAVTVPESRVTVMNAVPALFSCTDSEWTAGPPGPKSGREAALEADFAALLDVVAALAAPLVAIPPAAPTSAHVVATAIAPTHFLRLMKCPSHRLPVARVVAGSA
jgi:hypothetical protein